MEVLSIVVPCYNEEETVELFYEALLKVLQTLPYAYEIIYVNDGSKDRTLEKCVSLSEKDPCVKVIDFSRNFGKEAALLAGLKQSVGEYVTVMDADLQDPPEMLIDMFAIMDEKEVEIVGTRRVSRIGEPKIRSFFARCFYKLMNKYSEVEVVDGARDFRLMKRQVVDAILELKEYGRFSKGLFAWVGFKCEYLEYENVERVAGETSWSFVGLVKYALDGIVEYSNAPLLLPFYVGGTLSVVMVILFIVYLIMSLCNVYINQTTLVVSLILLLAGCLLLAIGVVGMYLGKTYSEVKGRPNYIIKKVYTKKDN